MRVSGAAALASTLLLVCCNGNGPGPGPSAVSPPDRYDWRETEGSLPPVGDQGESFSCAGWSMGYGATTFRLKHYLHEDWDLGHPAHRVSAAYLYNLTLQREAGAADVQQVPAAELDVQLANAVAAMAQFGIATEETMPFTADYARNPTAEAMAEAKRLRDDVARVGDWEFHIRGGTDEFWATLKERIWKVGPAVFTIRVFADLDCGVGSTYAIDPAYHVYRGTKHGVLCVGYDEHHVPAAAAQPEAAGGERAVLLMNSWGVSWADGGFLWVTLRDLLEAPAGSVRLLDEVWLPRTPPSEDVPAPDATAELLPEAWRTNPYPGPVWQAERGDRCGASVAPAEMVSSEEIRLRPGERTVLLRSPPIPLVAGLLKSTVAFAAMQPSGTSHGVEIFTLGTPQADPKARGAWIEAATLTVHDPASAPSPLLFTITVTRPNGSPFARKTLTLHLR